MFKFESKPQARKFSFGAYQILVRSYQILTTSEYVEGWKHIATLSMSAETTHITCMQGTLLTFRCLILSKACWT